MNWSNSLRRRAAILFENGLGYKAVSSELGINRETVRDWSYTWRALGTEEFLNPHCAGSTSYSAEVKLAVARDRINGMGVVEVMSKHHIHNRHRVKEWVKMYKDGGPGAFGFFENADASGECSQEQ